MFILYLLSTAIIGIIYIIYKIIIQYSQIKFLKKFFQNLSSAYGSLSPENKDFDRESLEFLISNINKFGKVINNFKIECDLEFFIKKFRYLPSFRI